MDGRAFGLAASRGIALNVGAVSATIIIHSGLVMTPIGVPHFFRTADSPWEAGAAFVLLGLATLLWIKPLLFVPSYSVAGPNTQDDTARALKFMLFISGLILTLDKLNDIIYDTAQRSSVMQILSEAWWVLNGSDVFLLVAGVAFLVLALKGGLTGASGAITRLVPIEAGNVMEAGQ